MTDLSGKSCAMTHIYLLLNKDMIYYYRHTFENIYQTKRFVITITSFFFTIIRLLIFDDSLSFYRGQKINMTKVLIILLITLYFDKLYISCQRL